ncbi:MAG: hypothetical protein KDA75_00225 [Planctomycetaceae bacterium]|nr:hypothetical protein [Planctomycetaceae bacterium]
MHFRLQIILGCLLLVTLGAAAGVWLLPVEFFQNWNVGRVVGALRSEAGPAAAPVEDAVAFAAYEAAGQAEFLTWLGRIVLPALACLALIGIVRGRQLATSMTEGWSGFLRGTRVGDGVRTAAIRIFVAAWMLLFGVHLAGGLLQRGRDWAYFQWRSGEDVLPNMSSENRLVIRYLQHATPPDARLLICSDQNLSFLSYYLRPRRVFHRVHPDAEFVIPQPGQSRPLAAYRLEDLTTEEMSNIGPDYIVEYFEGPDYVDADRRTEDQRWLSYWRSMTGSSGSPSYVVVLRPAAKGETAGVLE